METTSFTVSLPTFSLAATSAGSLGMAVGVSSVTISGAGVLASVGILGAVGISFFKGEGRRMGHNQYENKMWRDAMKKLEIKEKDVQTKLHHEVRKRPYAETWKELIEMLENILEETMRK